MPSFEIQAIALAALALFIHMLRLALEAQVEARTQREIEAAARAHAHWVDSHRLPHGVAFEISFVGYWINSRSTPVYGKYYLMTPSYNRNIQVYNWEDESWTCLSWDTNDILAIAKDQLVPGFDLLVAVDGQEFFLVKDSDAVYGSPTRRNPPITRDNRYKNTRLIGG